MGFQVAATPVNLVWAFIGALVGTIVGVLPGIGPLGSMAILLSFTLSMDATTAMIFFAGIYYGAMYGGSTTSILLNIPGEAASVVTCIDGYQMARRERGGAGYEPAPLVLALVIGPMMKNALRSSLMINQGAIAPMIFRPIAGTIYFAAALGLIVPPVLKALRAKKRPASVA